MIKMRIKIHFFSIV